MRSLLLVCLLATPALAQVPEEAKRAFTDGKAAFDAGDYEKALALFQRADAIAPAPNLSYNIGNCLERMGRFMEAADAFQRYLQLKGAPQDDEDRQFQDKVRA